MDANPDPGLSIPAQLIIIIACIILLGYFSLIMTAVRTVNRRKLKNSAEEGDEAARKLLHLTENIRRLNTSIRVFTLFTDTIIVVLTLVFFYNRFAVFLGSVGMPLPRFSASIIITIAVSYLVSVFGVIFPEKIALQHAELISKAHCGMISALACVGKPFAWISEKTANLFLYICRQDVNTDEYEFSEEEVMSMLESGQESGALKEAGMKMIDSIFAFDDKLAYEIMTPRTDVFSIDINDSPDEYMDEFMELKYSRIPVYKGDSDNIIGILNIKDFFRKASEVGLKNLDISQILRDPYMVPETKNIDSLFYEFQKTRQHIAILIDEYGGFAGIVTMEDIIEEVMGEIDDEYDDKEADIVQLDSHNYMINGFTCLDDVNEALGTDFQSGSSETIGGFLLDILGEIPDDDETEKRMLIIDNYTFTIESIKDRRIEKVKLYIDNDMGPALDSTD